MQLSVGSGGGTGKKKVESTLPSFMNKPSTSTLKKVDSYIKKTQNQPPSKSTSLKTYQETAKKTTSKQTSSAPTAYSKMKAIENLSKSTSKSTPTKTTSTSSNKVVSTPKTTSKTTVSKTTSSKPVVHASTVKSTPTSKPVVTTNKTTPTTSTAKSVSTPSSLDTMKNSILNSFKTNSDAYYNNQVASLGKARDEAILQQQQTYQNAVDQGQISIDDANKQFEADKKAIDQKFYQQAQATNISAYDNGLQNSMQMLGLQTGDNARQQNSVDTATSTRDQQINDIKNRLSSLASTRDLNIAGINSDYGYNTSQARAQADQMYNTDVGNFNTSNYNATQNQMWNQQDALQQHNWSVADANQQHAWDVAQANQQHAWDVQKQQASALSAKKATTTVKAPTTVSSSIAPIAQAYNNYKSAQSTTGLDQYYKSQTALNKGSVVQKNPVLPPVSLADNQALSPWQKMKIITGG